MLTLISSLLDTTPATPDTGTFADGAFHMPQLAVQSTTTRDRRLATHARDYGTNRTVETALIGYA